MNLYTQEGYELIGAAFEVHKQIGGGLLEEVYQECLEIELRKRQIPYKSKPELALFYGKVELRKRYFPDLLVHDGIVVELKAASQLVPEHSAQLFNYMRVAKKRVGYLLNFAPLRKLEWKRFVLEDASQPFRGPFIEDNQDEAFDS